MRRQTAVLVAVGAVLVALAVKEHVLHVGTDTALLLAVIVPSIIVHEVSHGVVALWFGDDTAKRAGRLTLNPLPHIDPFGTIVLPAILALGGAAAFGYAKPVPVDVRRLRHPRNHSLLVSLAGPATNIVLALASVVWLRVLRSPSTLRTLVDTPGSAPIVDRAWFFFGYVNVLLATFNLIPLPPLDGSALVERALPSSWWPGWLKLRQYAMPGLILLVLLRPSLLNGLFRPALRLWGRVLGI